MLHLKHLLCLVHVHLVHDLLLLDKVGLHLILSDSSRPLCMSEDELAQASEMKGRLCAFLPNVLQFVVLTK